MPTFAIETDREIDDFINEVKSNLARNVFISGGILKIERLYLFCLKPLVPPIHYFGFVWLGVALALGGVRLSPWLIPGILLTLPGIFHSKIFFYLMLNLGLKKKNSDARLKLVSNTKTLNYLVEKSI